MFKRLAAQGTIFFLRNFFVSKLEGTQWFNFVNRRVNDIEKVAQVVTDKNPEDKAQLAALWETEGPVFIDDSIQMANDLIEEHLITKINNPEMREYAENRMKEVNAMAKIVTDSNPDNEAQLKELWEAEKDEFIDDHIDLAIAIVKKKVKNEAARATTIMILQAAKAGDLV